jgi:hypothetical protein
MCVLSSKQGEGLVKKQNDSYNIQYLGIYDFSPLTFDSNRGLFFLHGKERRVL